MSVVEQNSVVSVMYTGTFPDSGEVFDSNVNQPPLVFLVGHGNIIEGFEQEILGAAVGDVKEFTLTPEMAYGHRDEAAVQPIPRSQFPEGMELEVGRVVGAQSDQGPVQFTVVEINDDIVIGDNGFPMGSAARTVSGWVKLDANATGDNTLLFYGKKTDGEGFWLGVDGAGNLEASGYGDTNASKAFDANGTNLRDGAWHHLAFSSDNSNNAKLYIDGTLASSKAAFSSSAFFFGTFFPFASFVGNPVSSHSENSFL